MVRSSELNEDIILEPLNFHDDPSDILLDQEFHLQQLIIIRISIHSRQINSVDASRFVHLAAHEIALHILGLYWVHLVSVGKAPGQIVVM